MISRTKDKCEKEVGAEIRGTLFEKEEKAKGDCIFCKKKAKVMTYVGKSY
jgi:hypothetical protein